MAAQHLLYFCLVAALTAVACVGASPAELVMLPASPQARCLDGTPPGYYIRRGAEPTKLIVHLQGGAWCVSMSLTLTLTLLFLSRSDSVSVSAPLRCTDPDDCAWRSTMHLGSSLYWPPTVAGNTGWYASSGGILSDDPLENPVFYNYTLVYIPYCDGSGFASARSEPLLTSSNATIYLQGRAVLDAVLDALETELSAATDMVVTGCSAGGLAVLTQLDHIASRTAPSCNTAGLADSGWFLLNISQYLPDSGRPSFELWNATGGVPIPLKDVHDH